MPVRMAHIVGKKHDAEYVLGSRPQGKKAQWNKIQTRRRCAEREQYIGDKQDQDENIRDGELGRRKVFGASRQHAMLPLPNGAIMSSSVFFVRRV